MRESEFDEQHIRDEEFAQQVIEQVQQLEQPQREVEQDRVDHQEDDEADQTEPREQTTSRKRRGFRGSVVWMFISGNVLIWRGLTRYYGQMIVVALLFLLRIVVMFWSLHLDMEYSHLTREVQLLRERSIRLQEVRSSRSSHSAIVKELERRGIDLHDPTTPATVIENGGFWR